MKRVFLAIALSLAALMLMAPPASAQIKLPRVSQHAVVTQTIGLTDVTITYSRPGVKGRTIWGDLVPYDKVWRTGANEATEIAFSRDVTIEGKPLPAGTYSLHTIPGKTSWTVIFNKKAEQWGSYEYDAAQDALRVQVTPTSGPNVEWMQFSFPDVANDSAKCELAWEKLRVTFSVGADTNNQALADIRKSLSGEVKEWNVPFGAASFAFANNMNTPEAMGWIDQSIAIKETFWNLRLKSQMLDKAGKRKDAIAVAEKALVVGKDDKDAADDLPKLQKQVADWKAGK
jgi:hypothetical protein